MRRFIALVLTCSLLSPSLSAEDSKPWNKKALEHFAVLRDLGPEGYIGSLEKGLGEKLSRNDRAYVKQSLATAFKLDPPPLPLIIERGNNLEIKSAEVRALLSLETGEENLWTLNGNKLEAKNKSLEELSQSVWEILSEKYNLGPYPNSEKTSGINFFDLLLPKAQAGAGLVLGVLVTAVIIGAIIYYTNKTTKASEKAIKKVGDSTARGIDQVSSSAANAIDKVGDSAATFIDKAGNLTDKASTTLDTVNEKVQDHDGNN